ncbi:unnamed protein product [Cercospora beticola]|nr:unnamed protein product [Cercospora beticola]
MMESLRDPDRQFRLLWLHAGEDDDTLKLDMRIFDQSDAPEYFAISYTWGSQDPLREVFIDGASRLVRPNCRDALWQARFHHGASWVWIDSLSMNQEDLTEKGHQVKRMGTIFASAQRVLCCIGMGTSDIQTIDSLWPESLVQDISSDRTHRMPNRWKEGSKASEFLYEPATAEEYHDLLMRGAKSNDYPPLPLWQFHAACDAFLNRPYWNRLWIVQEFKLAAECSILCGPVTLSRVFLENLWHRAECSLTFSSFGFDIPLHAHLSTMSACHRFAELAQFQCADVRDRIYGTIALYNWREHGRLLEPDYTRSRASLAGAVIHRSQNMTEARELCSMLNVDMHDEMIRGLVRSNQKSHPESSRAGAATVSCRLLARICVIDNDQNDRLEISQWDSTHNLRKKYCLNVHERDFNIDLSTLIETIKDFGFQACRAQLQPPNVVPQALCREQKVVGLVCHDALPGDLLMFLEEISPCTGSFCLVLRAGLDSKICSIVGQGIICDPLEAPLSHRAELRVSGNDLLMLFAQDLLVGRDTYDRVVFEIDRMARLGRLWTNLRGEVELNWCHFDRELKVRVGENSKKQDSTHESPRAVRTARPLFIAQRKYDAILRYLESLPPCRKNCTVRHLHNINRKRQVKWRHSIPIEAAVAASGD